MKPLMKINFDSSSMVLKSKWYQHFQETLPFIVGIVAPDARPVRYRSGHELGILDLMLTSKRERLVTE